ncbi:MAG: TrkA C-terminal domain-containing protein, partial [Longimicrobiales bacterium]
FPERESGQRLATRIASQSILNYVRLAPNFSIQEMAVPEKWIGKSLRELELPRRYRVSVVAVHDVLQDLITPVPDPDGLLKESDSLLVCGEDTDLARCARLD